MAGDSDVVGGMGSHATDACDSEEGAGTGDVWEQEARWVSQLCFIHGVFCSWPGTRPCTHISTLYYRIR